MSQGDPKFIGWTGGATPYQELRPQIQYEPTFSTGIVRKQITISRLCFDKHKQAVIQNLPFTNAPLNSTYVDTDGTLKTISFGGGYSLVNTTDVPAATGYSRISAVYEKNAELAFEFGLPDNLSISCEDGVGKIKYRNTTLEELDSGLGVCREGVELVRVEDYVYLATALGDYGSPIYVSQSVALNSNGTKSETSNFYSLSVNKAFFGLIPTATALRYQLKCNGFVFEDIVVPFGSSGILKQSVDFLHTPIREGVKYSNDPPVNITDVQLAAIVATTQQSLASNNDADALRSTFIGCESTTFRYRFPESGITNELYYRIYDKYRFEYHAAATVNASDVYARWERVGNLIRLKIGTLTIREYDVTGLD